MWRKKQKKNKNEEKNKEDTKSAIPLKIPHFNNSCAACAANELPVKSQFTVCSFNPQSPTVAPLQRNNPQPTGVSLISSRIQWANATTKAGGSGEQGSTHGFQLFWVNAVFLVPDSRAHTGQLCSRLVENHARAPWVNGVAWTHLALEKLSSSPFFFFFFWRNQRERFSGSACHPERNPKHKPPRSGDYIRVVPFVFWICHWVGELRSPMLSHRKRPWISLSHWTNMFLPLSARAHADQRGATAPCKRRDRFKMNF